MTDQAPTMHDATVEVAVVEAFLAALERLDVDTVLELSHAEIVYQNVPWPAARGRKMFERQMRAMARYFNHFEAINHNIAGNGPIVLTERTDVIGIGRFRMSIKVCGTFDVRDGKIVLWRDYFDHGQALVAVGKGVVQMVLGRNN